MPPKLSFAAASILLAVDRGYPYGFDIMDYTGLPSGTVYPALRRLEETGLIASAWEEAKLAQLDQRPLRKYYSMTIPGASALETALRRYPLLDRAAADYEPRKKE